MTAYRQASIADTVRSWKGEKNNTNDTHGEASILPRCSEFGRNSQSAHCQGRQFVNRPTTVLPLTLFRTRMAKSHSHSLPVVDSEMCL